jgi:lysophospholipase L1-like esterase
MHALGRLTGRSAAGLALAVLTAAILIAQAPPPASARTLDRAGPATSPESIVQLGDSVASGEGTLYGYRYDPATQKWTGGNIDAKWPGPYPLCHDSPDAYGQLVASAYHARLSQFACTGASFSNGISAPRVNYGYLYNTTLRPAEFGNWDTQQYLNAQYDAAKPDLVLVTLGADDVQFVAIVEACIQNAYEYYLDLASLQCVPGNPGSTITQDFTDYLPMLRGNYQTLVRWINARGQADGLVPKVVFTDYYDPLPAGNTTCPDSNYLYSQQIQYLSDLLHQLDTLIIQTIDGLHDPNVAVADVSKAFDGHQWCSPDPWAYGLSIYSVTDPDSFYSQAPFHPTPRGQQQLASLVEPVIDQLFRSDQGTAAPASPASQQTRTGS